jgi:IclR family pca regulon transcriptional regulator
MAVLEGDNVMYIAHVPNSRRIRYNGSVGYRSPAFGTSLGLVLWACLDDTRLESALAKASFPAYTSKTLTTAAQLRAAIEQARTNGFATAQEQLEYDIVAIAVPVKDTNGNVFAAVNCSSELTRNDMDTLVATRLQPLRDTASQIERGLQRFPALAHSIMTS